ncbi:hypothetical protein [Sulfuriroseicoccus oceanibius]|uniref:Uncharacterized protein n=1 Tax=Sulfuriroseicoccus oceanibius TaxID=2707525 RepID=A0A6B3LD79_9BACT|nr:hypothetical protein [Sulfuriroseicoccus oceanibius]QQL44635.1 hypothetical protein G3M56_012200 [Sulfuriroseicoccus oceanibius]
MTESSASKPIHPIAAFVLGIAGFLSFAALAIVAYFFFRGSTVDDYLSEQSAVRIAEREAIEANAAQVIGTTKWLDEGKGLVQPAMGDYLPVFGQQLLTSKPSVHTPASEAATVEEAPVAEPVAPVDAEPATDEQPAEEEAVADEAAAPAADQTDEPAATEEAAVESAEEAPAADQ